MPGFGQPAQMGNGPSVPAMDMHMPPGMSEQQQAEFQVSMRALKLRAIIERCYLAARLIN